MKKWLPVLLFLLFSSLPFVKSAGQCSICTKTAQQLGEKPAAGLNSGILYLVFAPFAIAGVISYRMWKNHRKI